LPLLLVPQENLSWYSVLKISRKVTHAIKCWFSNDYFLSKSFAIERGLLELLQKVAGVRFFRHSVCTTNCRRRNYLRQKGYGFCQSLFVCLCVSKITQKVMKKIFWNFQWMSGMAKTTSDSILGVIRKESWILNHFKIFVNIALNGA